MQEDTMATTLEAESGRAAALRSELDTETAARAQAESTADELRVRLETLE